MWDACTKLILTAGCACAEEQLCMIHETYLNPEWEHPSPFLSSLHVHSRTGMGFRGLRQSETWRYVYCIEDIAGGSSSWNSSICLVLRGWWEFRKPKKGVHVCCMYVVQWIGNRFIAAGVKRLLNSAVMLSVFGRTLSKGQALRPGQIISSAHVIEHGRASAMQLVPKLFTTSFVSCCHDFRTNQPLHIVSMSSHSILSKIRSAT